MRAGRASVVTDHIERFTKTGIKLESGKELEADIIITATGFNIQLIGGMALSINGQSVDMAAGMAYRGTLFEGVPNAAMIFGYTNSSWTLKADISSEYVCRLLNYMSAHGHDKCVPINKDGRIQPEAFITDNSGAASAGYIQRALAKMPKQGTKAPWRVYMNYLMDLPALRYSRINDGTMQFSSLTATQPTAVKTAFA